VGHVTLLTGLTLYARYCALLIIGALAFPGTLPAEPAPLSGTPSLRSIPMPNHHIGNNYSFVYGPDGRLHVGGTHGVYTYDGRGWQHFRMPNGQLVRQLLMGTNNRLYVGGYDQFGYIEWDVRNQPTFTDLSQLFSEALAGQTYADIWQIVTVDNQVFFRGVRHLFAVDLNTLSTQIWHHEARFGVLYQETGELFMQYRGQGLRQLQGTEFVAVPGTESLTEQIMGSIPINVGERVLLERPGRWQTITGSQISALTLPASVPASNEFSAWLAVDQHTLALADNRGNLNIVDVAQQTHRVFRIANDYINELILLESGGLLALTDLEVIHVPWPSPWLKTGPESGLSGSILRLTRFGDHWLTLGNAGVLKSSGDGNFMPSDWTAAEAWDWFELEPGKALLAESYVLKEVSGDQARTISGNDIYPRLIRQSRLDPSIFYIGTELGIAVLQRLQGEWSTLFVQNNLIGLVRDIHETAGGELLMSVVDHGIVRAQFSADHRALTSWTVLDNSNAGLPATDLAGSRLGSIDNTPIASTADGFFVYVNGQFLPTVLNGLADLREANEILSIQQFDNGTVWAFSERRVLSRTANSPWQEHVLQPMNPGRINALGQLADSSVYAGGIASVLTLDQQTVSQTAAPAPGVAIRSVTLRSADGREHAAPIDGSLLSVPDRSYSLIIEFSPDRLPAPLLMEYEKRLAGPVNFNDEWDPATRVVYSDLRPGRYELWISARSADGAVSAPRLLSFDIQPRWFETSWARLLWLLLALAVAFLCSAAFTRWRLARLHADRKRLQHLIQEQTAELATANRKLENMAHVDALTGIANRRQLDRYLPEAASRCIANKRPLGLILIDVDRFKQFNDQFGHQRGDELLRLLADQLISCLRRSDDILARYGGEEFIAVLPGADADMVAEVAERMRSTVVRSDLGVTVSAGMISELPTSVDSVQTMIGEADKRLYRAKEQGRNRVVNH
jgi:diguanylate cyclase (GGDEF)-like protein